VREDRPPLLVGDRDDGEPTEPQEVEALEPRVAAQLAEPHGALEGAHGFDLDRPRPTVVVRVRAGVARHAGDPDDGPFASGVVVERLVARPHRTEVPQGEGVVDPVPLGPAGAS
jgi:hypothetical protein